MDISIRDEGGVKVVSFDGELDTSTSPDAEKYLNELRAD